MKPFLYIALTLSVIISFPFPSMAVEYVELDALIATAREHNPEIIAARQRASAAQSRVTQILTWDNPKLTLEYLSIPEGSFDIGSAMEKMYGISQMIPFPGKLSLKGKAARSEADSMSWEYKGTELNVVSKIKSAYAMYQNISKSIEIYRQTAELMRGFASVAESRYVAGKATQSDVLRAQIEAEKMSVMAINLEQENETVRAELNSLAGSNPDDPLGEPRETAHVASEIKWSDVQSAILANNSEILNKASGVEKNRWMKRFAEIDYFPDLDIAYRRKTVDGEWSGSDIMLGVSVPLWFWKQNAGVKEITAGLEAAEAEKKNTELMVIAKAKEIYTALRTQQRLIALYENSVIPRSEQSLKVTQSSFSAGRMDFMAVLDSVRSYLEFKRDYYNYVTEYRKNLAELERLGGGGGQK